MKAGPPVRPCQLSVNMLHHRRDAVVVKVLFGTAIVIWSKHRRYSLGSLFGLATILLVCA